MRVPRKIKTSTAIEKILRIHKRRYKIAVWVCSVSFILVAITLSFKSVFVAKVWEPAELVNAAVFFFFFSIGVLSNSKLKRYTLVDDGTMQQLQEKLARYPALHEALEAYMAVRPNLTRHEYKRFQHALKKNSRTDRRLARRAK